MLESIFYGTFIDARRLTLPRALYLLLVWLLLPLWAIIGLISLAVGTLFSLGLGALSEVADVGFSRPYFTWTGDVGLHDLRISPHEGMSDLHPLVASRVELDMPSWGVLLQLAGALDATERSEEQQADDAEAVINGIDHVGVRFWGLRTSFDEGLPDALRHIGLASAAPFEAEGCQRDRYWSGSDLELMGIGHPGVDLGFTIGNDRGEGIVRIEGLLESPGASRMQFTQHFRTPSLIDFMDSEPQERISVFERIEVNDLGFVAARDAYCAKRAGIDRQAFRERHLQSIQRRLLTMGMQAGPEVEAAYRAYLDKGWLRIEAKPTANVRRADYHHYALADQQTMYNAELTAGGVTPVALRLQVVDARGIPASFGGSTWDLIARETAEPDSLDYSQLDASGLSGRRGLLAHRTPPPPPPAVEVETTDATAPLRFDDLKDHIGAHMRITTVRGISRTGVIESFSRRQVALRVYVAAGYAIQHIERDQVREIQRVN
ncbi:MAG TPA: hypothetical protein VFY12_08635 [Arenimonas sp.]|nr:hypothetical protein [Arenimonas sp.]